MREITEIIIHCSATKEGMDFRAKDIDAWHKAKGWAGIGYHFVIDLDGTIEQGRPINQVGAHCYGHNKNSIGVCYIGGLDSRGKPKDTRTEAQKVTMTMLLSLFVLHVPKGFILRTQGFRPIKILSVFRCA